MQIIWYGQSCFQILTNPKKNGQVSIIIDPFDETLGLRIPKMEADVLLISHDHYDHNNIKAVSGDYFLIKNPGEYEIKGVFIKGIQSYHDKTKGVEKILDKSVTKDVIRNAPCSVLVVKTK